MASVKDKASAGCDHLRYMLSSWFESSQDETDPGSNSASMVGQAKPETQEQIRSFVLEVLFCAWKMHALGPGVRGNRSRAGSNPGWVRHGVTPVLSARGGGARNSGSNGDALVSRGASLAGVRQARQLGSRYLRVQTTPPDHVQFGRRSPSRAGPSPPPQPLPPPWPRAPPPPLTACSAPRRVQRSNRRIRSHRNKKRSNLSNAGKKNTHRPNSSPAGCSGSPRASPELLQQVFSPQRCQSAANNRQDLTGGEQDTAGRKALLGDGWGGWADPHRPVSERGQYMEKNQDRAGRKALLGNGWQGRGGRHRPVTEWDGVERREKRTNFSVVLCGGAGLGSRRARRERPTKPVEVLRRVTACLERYSHLEARQKRAVTLCRAAQLAQTRPSSSSEVITTATTKVAKPGGGVIGHRSGRPTLAPSTNGIRGLGRGFNGDEGIRLNVNGNAVGGGVSSSEGLGRDANGNVGLGRYVNDTEGLRRRVNGSEGLCWYVNGNEGLGRGVNGYTARSLGRRNAEEGGGGGGADVVDNVRSEMLGRGPSPGKESEREDRWI